MAAWNWVLRSLLLGLLPVGGLAPQVTAPARGHWLVAAQRNSQRAPHVYTNDDPPFNRPPAEPPAETKTDDKEQPGAASPSNPEPQRLAPFVPTPQEVVEKMLEVAKVTPSDVVYDLGSGDGRIVITAARKYGAKAVGVELDPHLVEESRDKIHDAKLENLVTIIQGDLLKTSMKEATVVTIYLLPLAYEKIRPNLEKDLGPGSRVICHDMAIPGWTSDRMETVTVGNYTHTIFVYKVPGAFQKPSPDSPPQK